MIFPANSQPGSTQNFNVQLNDDQVPELTENFQLSTRSDFPGAVAVRPTATGIIEDDDRQLKNTQLKSSAVSCVFMLPHSCGCWLPKDTV